MPMVTHYLKPAPGPSLRQWRSDEDNESMGCHRPKDWHDFPRFSGRRKDVESVYFLHAQRGIPKSLNGGLPSGPHRDTGVTDTKGQGDAMNVRNIFGAEVQFEQFA